jgi:hypothetical protein
MSNKFGIFTRMLLMVSGFFISLASCGFTCRYIVLHDTPPELTGNWLFNTDIWFYYSKLVGGGIGVFISQVCSLIAYRKLGFRYLLVIFWLSTVGSILVTFLSYYDSQLTYELNSYNTRYEKAKAQYFSNPLYKVLQERQAFNVEALNGLIARQQKAYEAMRSIRHTTKAVKELKEYEELLLVAEKKTNDATQAVIEFQEGFRFSEPVIISNIYGRMALDIAKFYGKKEVSFEEWLTLVLNWMVLFVFSAAPDLIGPFLISIAFMGSEKMKHELDTTEVVSFHRKVPRGKGIMTWLQRQAEAMMKRELKTIKPKLTDDDDLEKIEENTETLTGMPISGLFKTPPPKGFDAKQVLETVTEEQIELIVKFVKEGKSQNKIIDLVFMMKPNKTLRNKVRAVVMEYIDG